MYQIGELLKIDFVFLIVPSYGIILNEGDYFDDKSRIYKLYDIMQDSIVEYNEYWLKRVEKVNETNDT